MRVAVFAAVGSMALTGANAADLPLLPEPKSVTAEKGSFSFADARIAGSDASERAAGERLQSLLTHSGGPKLSLARAGQIRFRLDPRVGGEEAYRLTVTPRGVDVSASTGTGLYYGAETLWQLMASARAKQIPAVTIFDKPAFSWRGIMLDSARHMQPVAYVERLIDRMAMAKLNVLHWHLTDDQGWRIEIDRYPRLTSIGAWRQEAGAAGFDKYGKPLLYGGYYSKKQIRAVVSYAHAHHVLVIPEIDVPGHATAIIAAYPELASIPNPPTRPSNDWGILPNLLNPSDETFAFLDNVLDEVMPLFAGSYIHLGGDEAVKDQWKASPDVQAKIKRLGLKDEDALQGWFTARLGDYLAKHGKRLVGWDEILGGKVPGNAVVMSWHGIDGAITAAKTGHDTVLAASPMLYLDHIQSLSGDEPPGRAEIIGWRQLYGFDPSPAELTPEQRRHILGLQANLWTEHVRTTAYADRMIWPRAAILAELAWSNPRKDWPKFALRLVAAMQRWRAMGEMFDLTPLEPLASFSRTDAGIAATLRQPADIGTLRFTTDGSRPTDKSTGYLQPLALKRGTKLSAQAFAGNVPLGAPKMWLIEPALLRTRTAAEMELCSNAIALRLEDDGPPVGKRPLHWVDIMNPCWIWRGAPLSHATRITAQVGRLPFNFAIGADVNKISYRPPATWAGELQVRRDTCDGPLIATIALEPATHSSGVTEIAGPISAPSGGDHDLCMTFTQKGPDPFWVLDWLRLQ